MIPSADIRRAFVRWLRTGRLPPARRHDGVEVKFNPYHDPRNGRFTFKPGNYPSYDPQRPAGIENAQLAPGQRGRPPAPGGNIRAFQDPMTIEQTFPGLQAAPGGAIIALADGVLQLTWAATALQVEIVQNWTRQVFSDIKAIDPGWNFDRLGPTTTLHGQISQLKQLRFDRAAMLLRVRNHPSALQVETLRFLQERVDATYARGHKLVTANRLRIRLSTQKALGNFIDREVRRDLRLRYNAFGIRSDGPGPVRVNRREISSSGTETSFRRPDARVGQIAYDVTISNKTLKTAQVRGFFEADFRPEAVVIIRPRQLGPNHTYLIVRPRDTQR